MAAPQGVLRFSKDFERCEQRQEDEVALISGDSYSPNKMYKMLKADADVGTKCSETRLIANIEIRLQKSDFTGSLESSRPVGMACSWSLQSAYRQALLLAGQ